MPPKGIVPGDHPDIRTYLRERNRDYRTRRQRWYSNPAPYDFLPDHWPSEVCILVRLPTELVLMVIEDLYQADLYHLALTCRRMAECTISTLYTRDITRFGCIALRWSCTFGIIPTLERALWFGAPVDYIFHEDSAAGCDWVIGGWEDSIYYFSPLVTAIAADEPHAVRALCAHGADANGKPFERNRLSYYFWIHPIHFVMGHPDFPIRRPGIRQGNPDIVKCLFDAGADPNQGLYCDTTLLQRGVTPLFLAMQSKVPAETVRLLLEHGADPAITGAWVGRFRWKARRFIWGDDMSPLEMLLLPGGADPDWPWGLDLEKLTLLLTYGGANVLDGHRPSQQGGLYPVLYHHLDSPEIVRLTRLFIAKGADLAGWEAQCGISPIEAVLCWAAVRCAALDPREVGKAPDIISRTCELVAIMAEATLGVVESNDPSNLVAERSTILDRPVRTIKDAMAEFYVRSTHDPTPLSYVCSPFRLPGGTRLIDTLLWFGANINAASGEGVTALHHAVMFNTGVAIGLLVESSGGPAFSGLDVNAPDCRGWTPLHYACHFGFSRRQTKQADAVRVLLDHGANIHARTVSGITPLLLAVWCSNGPVVELLLDRGARREDLSIPPFEVGSENPYNPLVDHPGVIFEDTPAAWRGDEEHVTGNILKIRGLLLNHTRREEVEFIDAREAPDGAPTENLHSTASIYEPCFFEIEDVTQGRYTEMAGYTTHSTYSQRLKFASFNLRVYVIDTFSHHPYRRTFQFPWVEHAPFWW